MPISILRRKIPQKKEHEVSFKEKELFFGSIDERKKTNAQCVFFQTTRGHKQEYPIKVFSVYKTVTCKEGRKLRRTNRKFRRRSVKRGDFCRK